jgi:beta-glucosidase
LFPFGHGLSYTSFAYSGLSLSAARIAPNGTLEVRCKVKNDGRRAGKEVVELYLRTNSNLITMPVLELKKFAKVSLESGEEKEVRFTLTPADLAHLNSKLQKIVEDCDYEVMIGASSADIRLRQKFVVSP